MNTNRRRTKLRVEDVARIKIMLHFGIPGKAIAQQYNVEPGTVSHINVGSGWQDVKVDFARFSAGPCIGCGKLLIDGVDDLIYLVADDSFLCGEKCETQLLRANKS